MSIFSVYGPHGFYSMFVRDHLELRRLCEYCLYVYRGLPTGIYTTNGPEACHFVANSSQANIIVVENAKQLDKILKVRVAVTEVCVDSLVQNKTHAPPI